MTNNAVVIFSGGQDSTTCLYQALQTHDKVFPISFFYGQVHSVEIACARLICRKENLHFKLIELDFLRNLVTSALTDTEKDVNDNHERLTNLPASFVPNRNALFITIAHAYAQEVNANSIYMGVCQTDYSGYPDCRDVFIRDMESALNEAYKSNIVFRTPLMFKTKAETFQMAADLGDEVLKNIINYTHTCYNGKRDFLHEWGYGCCNCPACELRRKGYREFIQWQR